MSRPLKVTHVLLSLDLGGLERNVINLIREGQHLGQQVSVVCLERAGTLAPSAEALGATLFCLHKRPGVRLATMARMGSILRALQPDVVHTHQIGPLFYTGPAARWLRVPLVVHTAHGKDAFERRSQRWLGRFAGHFIARFFCLTQDMAAWVAASRVVPATKLALIHNAIDLDAFQARSDLPDVRRLQNIPRAARVVGTVGRLNEIKRHELLLQAFAGVLRRVPDAYLLLVGDGPRRANLQQQAVDLHVAERVRFAGYRPQVLPYLQAMDVFALTSRSEGMPQATLEAAAAGVPLVASAVGGLPELIEHGRTGMLFARDDEAGLTELLCELLTDRRRATELAEAARIRVNDRYHIRRMASEYHHHYLELLAQRDLAPTAA